MVKNAKLFSFIMVILALSTFLVVVTPVLANNNLKIDYLKINDEEQDAYSPDGLYLEVQRGQDLSIRLKVHAENDDVQDVQISAGLYGYEYSQYEQNKIFDMSKTFDLKADRTRSVDLNLKVPLNMNTDDLLLRIFVADRDSLSYTQEYKLDVVGVDNENAVVIKDAYLSPSNEVMAGRALSALVKVENVGQKDFDDATLVVSVPALNIRDTETLDQLDSGDKETFEKTILRFPKDAQPGDYVVDYTVKFDEYESVTKTGVITVLPCEDVACGASSNEPAETGKTLITVPNKQIVTIGTTGAVYPILINNMADSAKTYTIQVQGVDMWGTAQMDPGTTVIVPAKNSQTVFLNLQANEDAQAGEKYFKLTVNSDGDTKDIPLTASVQEGTNAASWDGLKKVLEIGLIILVIILIIIGLIVGFNKLRGSGDDDDEDAKTYY